ncbi:hypothetical protein [Actinoplanes sp. L3-i22]|uniref:hypothetical protein n=1 Tax=Actinoplanes sp. L3-i22 TaxID=2836373 RepID=UPI001C741128|nr:hypothetical protein [Actinoplanes sp. L3-i22]BCY05810.1 hypothetical protein L3i22_008980 [Actinoplanes sp. L3-i22]
MRHLRSILYALVLAPAVWVLAGVGFTHDLTSRGRDFFTAESLSGLLLLIFAGILFAIMAFSPISPLGPTVAGAVFLGVTYWAWSAPDSYAGIWSPDVVKDGFDLSRPGYGLAALLAVPLLCTALSARRWARYEPPVLPIIGEIGRFRGSAKAPGVPMASAETTVFRTAQPPAAQAADRTQVLRTPPASPVSTAPADATVALPAGGVPSLGGPRVAAAGDDTTTVFAAAKPAAPNSNKSGITANPTIAPDAGKIAPKPAATDDQTVAMTLPAKGEPSAPAATVPAKDADHDQTTVIPAQAAPKDDDQTTVIPAQPAAPKDDDATEVMPSLVTPPDEHTEVLKIPAK